MGVGWGAIGGGPGRRPIRLVLPGDGPAVDGAGAGVEQGLGAGVEGGAGGGDVVDDEQGARLDAVRIGGERPKDVRVPRVQAGLLGLLGGGAAAAQGALVEGDFGALGEQAGEDGSLVVAAAAAAAGGRRPAAMGTAVIRSMPGGRCGSPMAARVGAAVAVRP